jgi:hypothetical protein
MQINNGSVRYYSLSLTRFKFVEFPGPITSRYHFYSLSYYCVEGSAPFDLIVWTYPYFRVPFHRAFLFSISVKYLKVFKHLTVYSSFRSHVFPTETGLPKQGQFCSIRRFTVNPVGTEFFAAFSSLESNIIVHRRRNRRRNLPTCHDACNRR